MSTPQQDAYLRTLLHDFARRAYDHPYRVGSRAAIGAIYLRDRVVQVIHQRIAAGLSVRDASILIDQLRSAEHGLRSLAELYPCIEVEMRILTTE